MAARSSAPTGHSPSIEPADLPSMSAFPGTLRSTPPRLSNRDWYSDNPLIHRDRRLGLSDSEWIRSFDCQDMGVLIVCRGPIRKEAIDVFREMGIEKVGMLLSEKDSIVYTHALAPELRFVGPGNVHRVRDYSGATKEERIERVEEIIDIAKIHGYDSIFAGYGFMAEDESFVRALERAGLRFIGPCSYTQGAAGHKDEARKTAIAAGVSVTPGLQDLTARTLLRLFPTREKLLDLAKTNSFQLPADLDPELALEELAELLLTEAVEARKDLFSIDELAAQAELEAAALFEANPNRRFRLKAIGGGGGKGQRIIAKASEAPSMLREVLAEVKATGVGDDKNVLLELNIESTRHLEIQLVGNGKWCIALGGRDCSLQMHEQKLLEVSLTSEALEKEIRRCDADGNEERATSLRADLHTLRTMEAEAERFGERVRLDSASTFEGIVSGHDHYFMEVNTRIQVEHRVSELCYALRFANPDAPHEFFEVTSLVEAMALLARHGERLPRPTRIRRESAAVEARLNATDRALSPHAGGKIISWSDPIDGEIRDDQGICYKNPDTGLFKHYRVAGAYDSNIALIVTTGSDRHASYEQLTEALRLMRLRGEDVSTNLSFHYGLVSFFLYRDVFAKPTTAFVVPYLTLLGRLHELAGAVDLDVAWKTLTQRYGEAAQPILAQKATLVRRPLERLLAEPHLFSAWLSSFQDDFELEEGKVRWLRNPIEVLSDTYHLLNMDRQDGQPAAFVIWRQDDELLQRSLHFYAKLRMRLGSNLPWSECQELLCGSSAPQGKAGSAGSPSAGLPFGPEAWRRVRASHRGFQAGLELLGLLAVIGEAVRFFNLRVRKDLSIEAPDELNDPDLQKRMRRVLSPPPATTADVVAAPSGGMFYAREAPNRPAFVQPRDHVQAGDPLFIIEVMKMFNKVVAPFSGVVQEILIDTDGSIVRKGQPIVRMAPDEKIIVEDPSSLAARRHQRTKELMNGV